VSLFSRLLDEDDLREGGSGIVSRSAGKFHAFRSPQAIASTDKVKADQIKKARRRAEKRAETRLYLRQVALGEARRPLQSLGG
jgi:hypothetical protein